MGVDGDSHSGLQRQPRLYLFSRQKGGRCDDVRLDAALDHMPELVDGGFVGARMVEHDHTAVLDVVKPALPGHEPVKKFYQGLKNYLAGATIAQWICLRLPSFHPAVQGSNSRHNIHGFSFWFQICRRIVKKTKKTKKKPALARF